MPNQRARDKKKLNVWLKRELFRRCEIYAQDHNTTISQIITEFLIELTADVELTSDDYKDILIEMERKSKGSYY